MINSIIIAITLFVVAAGLLVAEVFVPSFGLITVCALTALIGGIYIFFGISTFAGYIGIAAAVVMIPTVLIIAFKLLPKTKFGKNVTLQPPGLNFGEGVPDAGELKDLLGTDGFVITPLRPVGTCQFGNRRLESVSESGFVEAGQKVTVIKVDGTQLTVRVSN